MSEFLLVFFVFWSLFGCAVYTILTDADALNKKQIYCVIVASGPIIWFLFLFFESVKWILAKLK